MGYDNAMNNLAMKLDKPLPGVLKVQGLPYPVQRDRELGGEEEVHIRRQSVQVFLEPIQFEIKWEQVIHLRSELLRPSGEQVDFKGGSEVLVSAELVPNIQLALEPTGEVKVESVPGTDRAVYFVAREGTGNKVVTSPFFVNYV